MLKLDSGSSTNWREKNNIYNMPLAMLLNGNLNLAALEGAIAQILRRHEVLRTRFQVEK
ncbi:MAG: condensation domain-containing protein [Potamolinea sp.]